MSEQELKTCPFCGGNSSVSELYEQDDRRYYEMELSCDNCGCAITERIGWNSYKDISHEEASKIVMRQIIDVWNIRHDTQELEQLQARNRALVEALKKIVLEAHKPIIGGAEGKAMHLSTIAKQALSNPNTTIYKAEQEVIEAATEHMRHVNSCNLNMGILLKQALANLKQAKEESDE